MLERVTLVTPCHSLFSSGLSLLCDLEKIAVGTENLKLHGSKGDALDCLNAANSLGAAALPTLQAIVKYFSRPVTLDFESGLAKIWRQISSRLVYGVAGLVTAGYFNNCIFGLTPPAPCRVLTTPHTWNS